MDGISQSNLGLVEDTLDINCLHDTLKAENGALHIKTISLSFLFMQNRMLSRLGNVIEDS